MPAFDPGKKKATGQRKVIKKSNNDNKYIIKEYEKQNVLIYMPKEDINDILGKFHMEQDVVEQKVSEFADLIKYRNAPMEEVNKLWPLETTTVKKEMCTNVTAEETNSQANQDAD